MKHNDEYNVVNITNEDQLRVSEFSSSPKDEISSYRDNSSTVTRDEANDSFVSNSEKKETEQKRRKEKKEDIKKESEERLESEGASKSTSGSSSSSASSGFSASAVTGTVVAAATVAVTALAAVAGINVITGENARIKMEEFGVQQTEMFYGLTLFTDKEDTANYFIYVTNPTYSASQPLLKGPEEGMSSDWPDFDPSKDGWFNGGSFTNLTPGTRYDLSVKDSGFGGKVLYESSFVTSTKPNQAYNGVYFESPDYMNDTFTVRLDYTEEQTGYFDNFNIVISNGQRTPLTKQLEATTEPQTISTEDTQSYFDLMTDSFSFTMEYTENGENRTDSGSFDFNEGGTMKSELNSITVDPNANYINNTFDVTADFTDDFNVIDRISISFLGVDGSGGGYGFQLEKGFNRVSAVVDNEVMLDLTGGPYNYRISYYLKDNLYQYPETFDEQEPVTFVDSSYSAYFSDITFSEPDYQSKSFSVQLDYTETIENTFKDFNLSISNGTTETSLELDATTDIQTLSLSHIADFDLNADDYTFTLTYSNGNVPGSYEGQFSFKGQAKSEFNGVSINRYIDFDTGEFEITLDVYNDLGTLNNFTFTLIEVSDSQEVCTENLLPVRDPQTVTAPTDGSVNLALDDFSYIVTYYDGEEQKTYDPRETNPSYYFEFDISSDQEPSIDAEISESADFINNIIHVALTYDDPHGFIGSSIYLRIFIEGDEGTHEFYISKSVGTKDVEVNFSLSDHPTFSYDVDYTIPHYSRTTARKSTTVIDETIPSLSALHTDFKMYQRTESATAVETVYKMAFKVDYVDNFSIYTGFTLVADTSSNTYQKTLSMSHGWQYATFSQEERDFIFNDSLPVSFTLKAARLNGTETVYDEVSLDATQLQEGESGSVLHGVSIDEYVINGDQLTLSYLLYDDSGEFTNFSLAFGSTTSASTFTSNSFTLDPDSTTATITLSALMISMVSNGSPVNVILNYTKSGTVSELNVAQSATFTVNS